jgi:dephospho-CoA kinase
MLRVGLTGGYATGKTVVARQLAELGCHVIYADELGHSVLEPGGEAFTPVLKLFGSEILKPNGEIDRKKLGAIVFPNPEKLAALNAIVHPAVFVREKASMDSFAASDPDGIAIVEAAILIETGRFRIFDRLILTTCEPAIQIERAMMRDNITRSEALARIERQMSFEQKRPFATDIVDTSGNKEDLMRRVKDLHRELLALTRH